MQKVCSLFYFRYLIDNSLTDWGLYFASQYDCVVPPASQRPNVVTLLSDNAAFSLTFDLEEIHGKSKRRKTLAVCVKPLSGYQASSQVIEWFEMMRAIGYTDIIVYDVDISGPGRHVMDYYAAKGYLRIVKFPYLMSTILLIDHFEKTVSPKLRYGLYQQIYLIAIHDCLYRFSSEFR